MCTPHRSEHPFPPSPSSSPSSSSSSSATQTYTSLTYLLHHYPHPSPPQLEILPPALCIPPDSSDHSQHPWSPLLVDGVHIGVSKKDLVGAVGGGGQRKPELKRLEASTVMLVWDPENVTAVNYRRQWFSDLRSRGSEEEEGEPMQEEDAEHWTLAWEINLLDGLLTAPALNKHTKSPTLWSYRWWLLRRFGVLGTIPPLANPDEDEDGQVSRLNPTERVLLAQIRREMEIIQKAGDVHPRNYHAWNYARRLVTHHLPLANTAPTPGTTIAPSPLIPSLTKTHFRLCLLHPTDTSLWSFLLFLLTTYPPSPPHPSSPSKSQAYTVLTEMLSKLIPAIKDTQGVTGETWWVFIRTLLAPGLNVLLLSEEERCEVEEMVEVVVVAPRRPKYLGEGDFGKRAWGWIERRKRQEVVAGGEDGSG
ncbi:hypothetical protein BDZ91DRAFT_845219 [Kalaharituber pfeilii]|nr:hypothetical protein BDZ91DRAFT_845219 [Kalaharituber pfeilii]